MRKRNHRIFVAVVRKRGGPDWGAEDWRTEKFEIDQLFKEMVQHLPVVFAGGIRNRTRSYELLQGAPGSAPRTCLRRNMRGVMLRQAAPVASSTRGVSRRERPRRSTTFHPTWWSSFPAAINLMIGSRGPHGPMEPESPEAKKPVEWLAGGCLPGSGATERLANLLGQLHHRNFGPKQINFRLSLRCMRRAMASSTVPKLRRKASAVTGC